MHEVNFDEALEQILAHDPRFHRDAYHFVRESLDYTQKLISKENRGTVRHVTGQELLDGIRQFALQQFGPMVVTATISPTPSANRSGRPAGCRPRPSPLPTEVFPAASPAPFGATYL
jgi:hypothetical protein